MNERFMKPGEPVGVLGGGSWGTALAHVLAGTGREVTLVVRDPAQAAAVNELRQNPRYLPGEALHPGIRATADVTALVPAALVVLAVPCQHLRAALADPALALAADAVLVNAAKGIETGTLATPARVVADTRPAYAARQATLSGPSFALETVRGKPTAVVLGCADEDLGANLREAFSTDWFRAYSSTDVTGVELGGAVKNVVAIGAGISDGLGFGHNARAALITRGLAEISRLGVALGARAATFMGLSGLGDLLLTCAGDLSRNRQVGLRLGRGEALDAITAGLGMVAEGVKTTAAVHALAQRHGVDMPVAFAVHHVLTEGLDPRAAVQALMARRLKEE